MAGVVGVRALDGRRIEVEFIAYPGAPRVAVALNYGTLWDEAGLAEGDKATVTLDGEDWFAKEQAALDITARANTCWMAA